MKIFRQGFATVSAVFVVVALLASCSSTVGSSDIDVNVREVDTAFGTVEVPERIESVVVIDGRRDLDIALAFDLPIVGIPVETETVPEIPGPLTEPTRRLFAAGVPELFPRNTVDLEAIARVDPDLIIGRDEVVEDIYDQLSTIAPVLPVGSTGTGVSWQQDVTTIGEALDQHDVARKILAQYTSRVEAVKTRHAEAIAATTVLPISTSEDGGMSVGRDRVPSIVLGDIGARFGAAWNEARPEVEYGPETVTAAADAVAMIAAITSEKDLLAMNANPLWTQLPAVRNQRIVRTDKFTNDGGPLTAQWTLDLVEQLYSPN